MAEERHTIDDYELINCVASGTHSQIWEATEGGGGKQVALKLLVPEAFKEREQIQVLKHEAKVQKSLAHPNFIRLHKTVVTRRHAYIVMDFFRAPNLKIAIGSDLVSVQARINKLVEGICLALAYLHEKGWVHRDLKPENILFNKSSELRVIDFSLSTRVSKLFSSAPKTIQGTRTYIAPETIRKKTPTAQTDIYSLGVTLFEVLTGHPPFVAGSPDALLNKHLKEEPASPSFYNKNVTPEMDRLLLRMLAKKPDKRHKDMNELLSEFRGLKVFKEDVEEIQARLERQRREADEAGGDLNKSWKLDSRSDAKRSQSGKTARPAPKPKQRPQPAKPQPSKAERRKQRPVPPHQGAPQFAPQAYQPHAPVPHPQPFPPMPPQGFPVQHMPPAGYPMPPGYVQGAPLPYPPPQAMPPAQHPQQQPHPPQPPPQQAPPAAGPQQPPPAQSKPPQPQAPQSQQGGQAPQQSAPTEQDHVKPEDAQLRPQAPIPTERHVSQSDDSDRDLPLMDEMPDIV